MLDLSNNLVSNIGPLAALVLLETLKIDHCCLENEIQLRVLSPLPALRHLWLEGNPFLYKLTSGRKRMLLLNIIPGLTSADGTPLALHRRIDRLGSNGTDSRVLEPLFESARHDAIQSPGSEPIGLQGEESIPSPICSCDSVPASLLQAWFERRPNKAQEPAAFGETQHSVRTKERTRATHKRCQAENELGTGKMEQPAISPRPKQVPRQFRGVKSKVAGIWKNDSRSLLSDDIADPPTFDGPSSRQGAERPCGGGPTDFLHVPASEELPVSMPKDGNAALVQPTTIAQSQTEATMPELLNSTATVGPPDSISLLTGSSRALQTPSAQTGLIQEEASAADTPPIRILRAKVSFKKLSVPEVDSEPTQNTHTNSTQLRPRLQLDDKHAAVEGTSGSRINLSGLHAESTGTKSATASLPHQKPAGLDLQELHIPWGTVPLHQGHRTLTTTADANQIRP
eukprot:jgi/Botrbrau1/10490/Bobra.0133s0093.1